MGVWWNSLCTEWGRSPGDAVSIDLDKAKSLFPVVAGGLVSPDGPVQMLVGMDIMKDAPREQARKKGAVLYQSDFSTGHVACGDMGRMVVEKGAEKPDLRVLSCRNTLLTRRCTSQPRLWEQNSLARVGHRCFVVL
jgi:hypothetical protein